MRAWLRYHRRRARFMWRLRNAWPHRVLCILGLRHSPSWDMHRWGLIQSEQMLRALGGR